MKLISIRKMKKRINVPANVKMGRICAIWLFCIALQAISIPILAQSAQITLRLKNVTVEEVLTSIENQTEYALIRVQPYWLAIHGHGYDTSILHAYWHK